MTIDLRPAAALPDEAGFPDQRQVVQRFGDLAPDGATSTVALSRMFEQSLVGLRFARFDGRVAGGGFGPYRFLFVSRRVERWRAFGEIGEAVRIGTGIRAIGRSSYTYGCALRTGPVRRRTVSGDSGRHRPSRCAPRRRARGRGTVAADA
ncbi:hypothetical protein [Streptomyces varsoviensis]|uniref:Uncharacterized protein n=1 Tax=Streptomyces varsoviensis TaxID=67373 RepID=A0ABR5JEF8_9ACTN|nr:hypothetical protein [Streptomyces varsoviensis]KOG91761.1 hypothetical protein ADK38_01400 [Streptomyces varsoviensis]